MTGVVDLESIQTNIVGVSPGGNQMQLVDDWGKSRSNKVLKNQGLFICCSCIHLYMLYIYMEMSKQIRRIYSTFQYFNNYTFEIHVNLTECGPTTGNYVQVY